MYYLGIDVGTGGTRALLADERAHDAPFVLPRTESCTRIHGPA